MNQEEELKVNRYTLFGVDLPDSRPEGAKEVFLLQWPQAGIEIPWPEGKTAKEAIIDWAWNEEGR